jgi:hypothetical protein
MRHAPVRPGPAGPCSGPQHGGLGVSQTEPGEGRGNGSRPVPGGPRQARVGQARKLTRIFTCLRSSITLGAHLEQRKTIERVKGPQFSEPP